MRRKAVMLTLITVILVACLALVFAACDNVNANVGENLPSDSGTVNSGTEQTGDSASSSSNADASKQQGNGSGNANGQSQTPDADASGNANGQSQTPDADASGNGSGNGGSASGNGGSTTGDNGAISTALPEAAASMLRLFAYEPTATEDDATAIATPNFTMINRLEIGAGFYMISKYLFVEDGFGYTTYYLVSGNASSAPTLSYYKKGSEGWLAYTPYTSGVDARYKTSNADTADILSVLMHSTVLSLPATAKASLFDPANYEAADRGYKYVGEPVLVEAREAKFLMQIDTFILVEGDAEISGKLISPLTNEEKAELGILGEGNPSQAFTCSILNVGKTEITYPAPFVPTEDEPIEGVLTAQIENAETALRSYLDSWAIRNATDKATDQKSLLKKDLIEQKAKFALVGVYGSVFPSFEVSYESGVYTVDASWAEGAVTKTLTFNAQILTYGPWAGKHSRTADYTYLDARDTYDVISAAFANTVNKVTGNAVTGKFALDGVIGFDAFGVNYGLQVKGNVDLTSAKDTEIGLVVVDSAGKELYGIYYKGAETAADSKLYLQYPGANGAPAYKYVDYANLIDRLGDFFHLSEQAGDGLLTYKDKTGDTLSVNTFVGLLEAFGASSQVQAIVPSIIGMFVNPYTDGEGRYLFDVNLSSATSTVSDLLSAFGDAKALSLARSLGIDLTGMHGLFGHVSLSVKIENEEITDVEIAVNIPKSVFYLGADEGPNAKKINIPSIGIALYLEGFRFLTDEKIENVIPAKAISDATYFSATNVNFSGDVYLDTVCNERIDATYHVDLVTDVNLLEILENGDESTARVALFVKEHAGEVTYSEENAEEWSCFFALSYEQASKLLCLRGTALGLEDGGNTVYKFTIGEDSLDDIKMWLGLTGRIGLESDDTYGIVVNNDKINGPAKESAQVIFGNKLVKELMRYYLTHNAAAQAEIETAEAGVFDELSEISDGLKELYDILIGEGIVRYEADPFSLSVNLDERSLAKLLAVLNDSLGMRVTLNGFEILKIEINSAGYENVAYLRLKVGQYVVEITLDGSKENKFTATVLYLNSERAYSFVFDSDYSDGLNANVTYDVRNDEGQMIEHSALALSDFRFVWGDGTSDRAAALLGEIKDAANEGELFPSDGTGPATKLAERVLGYLSSDAVYPTAALIGKALLRILP